MFATEAIPRPVRRALADWAGRLADRLADVRDQVRDAVIEAVGRTAAEAAEAALRHLAGLGRSAGPDHFAGWEFPADPRPAPPRPAPRRSWRAALAAGLHALAWWLRRSPGPALAAAAAAAGAAVLLLD